MTLADDHLAEIGAEDLDAWDRDGAVLLLEWASALPADVSNDAVREARLLSATSYPIVQFMISLPVVGMPGVDLARDADLAASAALNRRTVLANQAAGLNGRSTERNLRVLDRLCMLIGNWPEHDWSEAVRRRVERLAEARRDGRERGKQLRADGRMPDPPPQPDVGYLLCHPGDHWFRSAHPSITDPTLRAAVDEWIADLAPSYESLAAQDWSTEEASADAVVDLELPEEVPRGWKEPVPTTVIARRRGSVDVGSQLPLRLAPPGDQPFNGMLIHVLPRQRWRTCATLLDDGSAMPGDGTRRLHPAGDPRREPQIGGKAPCD